METPEPIIPPVQPKAIPFAGWKTVSIAATFLLAVLTSPDVQSIIATYPKSFGSGVAVAVVVLRLLTTTSIFRRD